MRTAYSHWSHTWQSAAEDAPLDDHSQLTSLVRRRWLTTTVSSRMGANESRPGGGTGTAGGNQSNANNASEDSATEDLYQGVVHIFRSPMFRIQRKDCSSNRPSIIYSCKQSCKSAQMLPVKRSRRPSGNSLSFIILIKITITSKWLQKCLLKSNRRMRYVLIQLH